MPPADHTIADLPRQPSEAVGVVVRRRREALGLTQEDLGEAAGLHVTYVRKIESGRHNPSVQVVWLLAKGLGVSFSALCTDVEVEVGAEDSPSEGAR